MNRFPARHDESISRYGFTRGYGIPRWWWSVRFRPASHDSPLTESGSNHRWEIWTYLGIKRRTNLICVNKIPERWNEPTSYFLLPTDDS